MRAMVPRFLLLLFILSLLITAVSNQPGELSAADDPAAVGLDADALTYLPILAKPEELEWIAYLDNQGSVRLINSDGRFQRLITADGRETHNYADAGLKWSPDGRLLAFVRKDFAGNWGQESLVVYDLASQAVRAVVTGEDTIGFAWAPDSARLVYGREIPRGYWIDPANPGGPIYGLWQVDLGTGARSELVGPQRGYPLARPDWSPGGRFLLFEEVDAIEGSGLLVIYDWQTRTYWARQIKIGAHTWAADGSRLVFDEITYVTNLGTRLWVTLPLGDSTWPLTPWRPRSSDIEPQYSPDGGQIAFLRYSESFFSTSTDLMLIRADGSGERLIASDVAYWFSWAPDNKRLAITKGEYQSADIYILDSETRGLQWLVEGRSPSWRR